jgi:hypothetical protein
VLKVKQKLCERGATAGRMDDISSRWLDWWIFVLLTINLTGFHTLFSPSAESFGGFKKKSLKVIKLQQPQPQQQQQ